MFVLSSTTFFMSWYVLSDDERNLLKKSNNDVILNKSYISIVDKASLLIIIRKEYIFGINHEIESLMRWFFRENRRFRKRLTKTKEWIIKTIQLFNATTLQQINKKKEKNKKMINISKKLTKNIQIKEMIEKKFLKKK